jgi:hypothetical protein
MQHESIGITGGLSSSTSGGPPENQYGVAPSSLPGTGLLPKADQPQVILDRTFRVRSTNRAFLSLFGLTREMAEGRVLFDLGERNWESPALLTVLERILAHPHANTDDKGNSQVCEEVALVVELAYGKASLGLLVSRLETRIKGQEMLCLTVVSETPVNRSASDMLEGPEAWLSHARPDMNACLAQIAGYAQLMTHHPDTTVREGGKAISGAADRMLMMVSQLSRLSDHGSTPLTASNRSPGALLLNA